MFKLIFSWNEQPMGAVQKEKIELFTADPPQMYLRGAITKEKEIFLRIIHSNNLDFF